MKYLPLFCLMSSPLLADFEKTVLPIITKSCVECHQPHMKRGKQKSAKAGLRLDSAWGIAEGGDGGPAVVPGKLEQSLLYTLSALDHDDDDLMPPKGESLTKAELLAIKKWIESGADFGKWRGVDKRDPKFPKAAPAKKEKE